MPSPELPRDEAHAALGARKELGEEMEPAVVEAFLERIERSIDARVDERMRRHDALPTPPASSGARGEVMLPLASLALAIPLTAIAGGITGSLIGILAVWIGIVAVNVAHARRR